MNGGGLLGRRKRLSFPSSSSFGRWPGAALVRVDPIGAAAHEPLGAVRSDVPQPRVELTEWPVRDNVGGDLGQAHERVSAAARADVDGGARRALLGHGATGVATARDRVDRGPRRRVAALRGDGLVARAPEAHGARVDGRPRARPVRPVGRRVLRARLRVSGDRAGRRDAGRAAPLQVEGEEARALGVEEAVGVGLIRGSWVTDVAELEGDVGPRVAGALRVVQRAATRSPGRGRRSTRSA